MYECVCDETDEWHYRNDIWKTVLNIFCVVEYLSVIKIFYRYHDVQKF